MNTIEGTWNSRYEYGAGANDEPQASGHDIEFTHQNEKWVGKSLPNKEGSEVTLYLTQHGDEFRGEWEERTSPTGSYGGRKFGGMVLFILKNDGNELSGGWLGRSGDDNNPRAKSGTWILKRIQNDK